MKIRALVVATIFSALVTPVLADDSQYNNQFEYGATAKAIDIARARLNSSPTAYDNQYEYGAAAKASDLALTADVTQSTICTGQSGCVSNSVKVTTFNPTAK